MKTARGRRRAASKQGRGTTRPESDMLFDGAGGDVQEHLSHFINQIDTAVQGGHAVVQPGISMMQLMLRTVAGFAVVVGGLWWVFWPSAVSTDVASIASRDSLPVVAANRAEASVSQASTQDVDIVAEKPERAGTTVPAVKKTTTTTKQVAAASQTVARATAATVPEKRLIVSVPVGNIRTSPNTGGKVLYRLGKGAVVKRLAVQGEWYQVRLKNGVVAWAHRSVF